MAYGPLDPEDRPTRSELAEDEPRRCLECGYEVPEEREELEECPVCGYSGRGSRLRRW